MKAKKQTHWTGRNKPGPATDLFAIFPQIDIGMEVLNLYEKKGKKHVAGSTYTLQHALDFVSAEKKISNWTARKYYRRAKDHREQFAIASQMTRSQPDTDWLSGLNRVDLNLWAETTPQKIRRKNRIRSRLRKRS